MKSTSILLPAQIEYRILVAIRGAIISDIYKLGEAEIQITYPSSIILPGSGLTPLPVGWSTMFAVRWVDTNGETVEKLKASGIERFAPFHYALEQINEFLLAFKLVRVGQINGLEIKTIGEADCLLRAPFINGQHTGELSSLIKTPGPLNPWRFANAKHPDDPLGTTALALPHIGQSTFPIGRKLARCFDLFDHGYYNEALIIAFAILDDQIQIALDALLKSRGLDAPKERKQFLRSIKDDRLKHYLGAVMKVLVSKSISQMWPEADTAIDWLNTERNKAMHGGYHASRRSAAFAIFVTMKILLVFKRNNILEIDFPEGMYRHARLIAAWNDTPPAWVPLNEDVENIQD